MTQILGALGSATRADLDPHGSIRDGEVALDWWIGSDDGWHVPAEDRTTRQRRSGAAPVFETAVRVPNGDALQRAYAVATPGGPGAVVVDVENASRAPFSVAFVAAFAQRSTVTLHDTVLAVDGRPRMVLSRPPRLWTGGRHVRDDVCSGALRPGAPATWSAPSQVALLVPAPHQTLVRAALVREDVDLARLADPVAVAQGWERQLDRGLRTELPESWQLQIDAQRADLLLARPSWAAFAALEDWGFDAEAAEMWGHLGFRARRRARQRPQRRGSRAATPRAASAGPAGFLLSMRQRLVREHGREIELLAGYDPEWLGHPLAVHDLPLRAGRLSYALRWHGARPALLWDAPTGVTLRAPALDASWSAPGGTGETLLAEPPTPLLAMGTVRRDGERVDDPDSFR